MNRSNGRAGLEELRTRLYGWNVLSRADGSATLVAGGTDILVAVNGPCPIKAKQEQTDRATLQVSVQTLSAPPNVYNTALSNRLRSVLEKLIVLQLHPRSLISVTIQPIHLDGSVFSSILNASIAALIDAAIPLRSTYVAVEGCISSDGQILLDSDSKEESEASAVFSFVFDVQRDGLPLVNSEINGEIALDQLTILEEMSRKAAQTIFTELRNSTKSRIESLHQ